MNAARRRQGFTLLELMIVMVILSILIAAFLVVSGRIFGKGKVTEAESRLAQLSTLIEQYRTVEGEYPDDRLPNDLGANDINSSSEALFVALFAAGYTGQSPDNDWLSNTDGDQATRAVTRLPGRDLFEICDPWGNPIVYFESLHYASTRDVLYWATEAGMDLPDENSVSPARDQQTGDFEQANRFQLLSAGPDGWFGTEDDVANYE